MQRILKADLELFPYKIQIVQQMACDDHQKSLDFAKPIVAKLNEDETFSNLIIMSDEAHFHLHGFVNRVMGHFKMRLNICIDINGSYLKDILFHL